MTGLTECIALIQRVGESPNGLAELAREAGVPYTTIKSFKDRGWANRSLDLVDRLSQAAQRIEARGEAGGSADENATGFTEPTVAPSESGVIRNEGGAFR